MGLGPLAWPSPLSWGATPPAKLWVGQTDPDRPHFLSPLSPMSSPANPNRHRCPLPILAISSALRCRHLGQNSRPLSSSSSTKWIRKSSPLRGDLESNFARVPSALIVSNLDASPNSFPVLVVLLRGGRGVCARQWKCRDAVLLGSPWSAARALPRHAVQARAWAFGECNPLLSSLLRPWSLAF
jgi:hypothetical protein